MTPAPTATAGSPRTPSPAGSPSVQSNARPSGGVHNSGQSAPYSVNEILALLHYVGFSGQNQANLAAIAMAESGGDPNAVHTNQDGSRDRGLFQINDQSYPGVSDACAFDPVCSARQAVAIDKRSGTTPWSTWGNGSAEAWLPQIEQAQKAGKWKQFQTQFQSDKIGQAGNAATTGAGSSGATATPRNLFDCSSQSVNVHVPIFGSVSTGLSTPDIGCYVLSTIEFTVYAVGGLILVGMGLLLIAHKNPLKVGLKAAALTPMGRVAGGLSEGQQLARQREGRITENQAAKLALQQQREQRMAAPRPASARVEADIAKEQRIAAKQTQEQVSGAAQVRLRAQEAKAKVDEAKAYYTRAQGYSVRRSAKYGPNIARPTSILGVEIPKFDVPGYTDNPNDPSRMKG